MYLYESLFKGKLNQSCRIGNEGRAWEDDIQIK